VSQKDEVFLIDSNSLISPYQLYYPFDFASRFWDQLKEEIENGNVIILDVIRDELMKGNDELSKWINQFDHNLILDRRTSEILENYGKILNYIQTSGLYKVKSTYRVVQCKRCGSMAYCRCFNIWIYNNYI